MKSIKQIFNVNVIQIIVFINNKYKVENVVFIFAYLSLLLIFDKIVSTILLEYLRYIFDLYESYCNAAK